MSTIDDILAKFIEEIPQFISVDCVSRETGSSVGTTSIDRNVDASMASSSYADVINANAQALDLLGIGEDTLEDILITARNAFVLVRRLGPQYFVSLIVTRRANLSLARSVLDKYEGALLQALASAS